MARAKKADDKAKEADPNTIQISVDDFVRTRDAVVTGLSTLQAAVQDLSRAYIIHTNTVLGRAPGTSLDLLSFVKPVAENGPPPPHMATPEVKSNAVGEEKKKRKREHDPNAPKRPLTPYFLYMQSARPIIASDLGESAKPGAVSAEGTRRWTEMPDVEKQMWKRAYAENLVKYQEKVAEYKASNGNHAVDDAAAAQLVAENGIVEDIDAEHEVEVAESADEEVEVEPPPKAKRSKPSEGAAKPPVPVKQTPVAPPSAKEIPPNTIVAREEPRSSRKDDSPKKRKSSRKSKGGDVSLPVDETPDTPEVPTEDKKEKKRGRKKRKLETTE